MKQVGGAAATAGSLCGALTRVQTAAAAAAALNPTTVSGGRRIGDWTAEMRIAILANSDKKR